MKRTVPAPLLAAALLALAAGQAHALWRQFNVTPGTLTGLDRAFTVTQKPVDGSIRFEVTMKATGNREKPVSPFISSELTLHDKENSYGKIPVAERRKDGAVTFRFEVSPKLVEHSWLELHESFYTKRDPNRRPLFEDERGGDRYELIMGGTIYRLRLGDFAGAGPAANRPGDARENRAK